MGEGGYVGCFLQWFALNVGFGKGKMIIGRVCVQDFCFYQH